MSKRTVFPNVKSIIPTSISTAERNSIKKERLLNVLSWKAPTPLQTRPHGGAPTPLQTRPQGGAPTPLQTRPHGGAPTPLQTRLHGGAPTPLQTLPHGGAPTPLQTRPFSSLLTLNSLFTLAISKCYGKVRVLFFRATTLVSARRSHSLNLWPCKSQLLAFGIEVN